MIQISDERLLDLYIHLVKSYHLYCGSVKFIKLRNLLKKRKENIKKLILSEMLDKY